MGPDVIKRLDPDGAIRRSTVAMRRKDTQRANIPPGGSVPGPPGAMATPVATMKGILWRIWREET